MKIPKHLPIYTFPNKISYLGYFSGNYLRNKLAFCFTKRDSCIFHKTMDKTGEKRKRSSNFQISETRLLVDTVLPFKEIIENKHNDSFNIQEKNHAWEKIAALFNAVGCGEVHRNSKVLKLKYEGMKKLLRRKIAEHKREMYASGRDTMLPLKMEDYEEKMYSIILCNGEEPSKQLEKYELSNQSTYDETEDGEMEICSPEITIKNEEIEDLNIEIRSSSNEIVPEPAPSLVNITNEVPRIQHNENTRNLKWKQFNTRKLKTKKQHSKFEHINKLRHQDNEITKQELEIEHLKREHELRVKIMEKELEEKEAVLRRNDEEHQLKMRLMEIQLKHKEFELLSKMNA